MRIGLVIDSACDLPIAFLRRNQIEIMPISLRFGGERFVDLRDPDAAVDLYERFIPAHGLEAQTEAISIDAIGDLFLDRLVTRYDRVLVIAIASTRSAIFQNATRASFAILSGYRERRKAAGLDGSFMLRVVDSGQLFTGEGVLVWDLVRRLRKEPDIAFDSLRRHAESFKQKVFAYAVPQDLFYLRERARRRGDRSVGWLQFQVGSLLDVKPIVEAHRGDTHPVAKVRHFAAAIDEVIGRAIERIEQRRLLTPAVVMSYAGDPREIAKFRRYPELRAMAAESGIELLESPMSATAGVYLGPGAFSLAYAAED